MLVIMRENNRIERKVNIGCNHGHKVTLLCCVLQALVIHTFFQRIDLCLLRLIEHNRDLYKIHFITHTHSHIQTHTVVGQTWWSKT